MNFYADLKKGKQKEKTLLNLLRKTYSNVEYEDVSNDEKCWHKGDIKYTNFSGEHFIEVKSCKNDCNALPVEIYTYTIDGIRNKGWFHYNYENIAFVNDNTVYFVDYDKLYSCYCSMLVDDKLFDKYTKTQYKTVNGVKVKNADLLFIDIETAKKYGIITVIYKYDINEMERIY